MKNYHRYTKAETDAIKERILRFRGPLGTFPPVRVIHEQLMEEFPFLTVPKIYSLRKEIELTQQLE